MPLPVRFLTFSLMLSTPALLLAAGQSVEYQEGGAPYEGYYVSAGKDAPLVILLHDWDGLTNYEIQRSEMLAQAGYSVFAADLFGKGIRPTEMKDKLQHTGELHKDRAKMRQVIQAAVNKAGELGGNVKNAITMGYCFGGAAVLEYARSGAPMKGFVTFHGGLKTPEDQDYSQVKAPVLVLHGAADTYVTMDQFAALTVALEAAKIPHEMIAYGGAPHAFTVFGEERYQETADKKSWARFLDFLKERTR